MENSEPNNQPLEEVELQLVNPNDGNHSQKQPLVGLETNRRKVKYHFKKLRNLFLFDSLIFGVSIVLIGLFAFGIVSIKKVLFFGIPFFCVFLSTLFFFGYIVWFDNGFKHDDEYTLEELQEMEMDYLTKGRYHSQKKNLPHKKKAIFQEKEDLLNQSFSMREDTSFLNGLNLDDELEPEAKERLKNIPEHEELSSEPSQEDHPVNMNASQLSVGDKAKVIIQRLTNFATPQKRIRPDWETKWDKMTPQQKIVHHRRAVRDRNEELEILKYAIYTRLFFTIISFLVCIVVVPIIFYSKDEEETPLLGQDDPYNKPGSPNYIDWKQVFPEDYEPTHIFHYGFFICFVVGAVVSFFLILIGIKMHQFYNELKEDVKNLNDEEVPLGYRE